MSLEGGIVQQVQEGGSFFAELSTGPLLQL